MANETKKSKKFTKSTIAMIVCLALIGALILATIIMAIVPTDKGVKFSAPDHMTITYDGKTANFTSGSAEYKEIWETYQNAGKLPVITSLFGGYAGHGMKANYFISSQDYSKLGSASDDSDSDTKNFVIRFIYNTNNEQTMKNGNGSDFVYGDSEDSKITPQFGEAVFEVTQDKDMQQKTFYLKSTLDSDSSTKTHITYTGVANYNSLYDLLKSMVEKNKFI